MNKNSFFKFIFFLLTAALAGMLIFAGIMLVTEGPKEPDFPKFAYGYFALVITFIIAFFASVSVYVYKDAQKRGMEQWMWMCIAVFIPNLIGLIIYILARNKIIEGKCKCINCGSLISDKFEICPYCGTDLKMHCSQCGKQISPEWNTCPYCSNKLK